MFFDEFFEKKFRAMLWKALNKVGYAYTYADKERMINKIVKFEMLVLKIGMFVFMIYFFNTMVYNRLGFDKTIILILTILLLTSKGFFK